jgi:hypothetical protein
LPIVDCRFESLSLNIESGTQINNSTEPLQRRVNRDVKQAPIGNLKYLNRDVKQAPIGNRKLGIANTVALCNGGLTVT